MREQAFGIKIGLPGKSANEVEDKKLIFNSGLNTFKFIKGIRLQNVKFPQFVDINTVAPIQIAHGLKYAPSYVIYISTSTGGITNPDGNSLGSYSDKQYINILGNNTYDNVIILIGADSLEDLDS